ncbi:hypothetical protein PHYSODRAFT_326014 [Phytophthora sojae]|uniref:Uncharacterized protein n=1 Tax=Phytophthora sojae (strain P6497) TaxID=1094619 RepID=G4YW71_PHYSP|nr:hypothetical protein PHYSODRAFT_326014 [Phytophthora sojae]EGZ24961.1 hypothetical protein PHYSODRAFT_326014 [Phytophthora sojae]|eukprot:XP_009520249.1 hypothetical protein PHYSODRAFT_326014 [Phytophthora sojae]
MAYACASRVLCVPAIASGQHRQQQPEVSENTVRIRPPKSPLLLLLAAIGYEAEPVVVGRLIHSFEEEEEEDSPRSRVQRPAQPSRPAFELPWDSQERCSICRAAERASMGSGRDFLPRCYVLYLTAGLTYTLGRFAAAAAVLPAQTAAPAITPRQPAVARPRTEPFSACEEFPRKQRPDLSNVALKKRAEAQQQDLDACDQKSHRTQAAPASMTTPKHAPPL